MEPVVTLMHGEPSARRRRTLDERLFARVPGTYRLVARSFASFPPRSRLRRALIRRNALSGWAAISRGDFDLVLVRYAPDVEYLAEPSLTALGLDQSYRGHEGMRRSAATFYEAWERFEYSLAGFVDLGDRVVTLGSFRAVGSGSGLPIAREFGQALTLRRGLIVEERDFMDWDAALAAFGLDPAIVADVPRPPVAA